MYTGKYKKTGFHKRNLMLVVSLMLVLSVGLGATIAYLIDNSSEVVNTFTPAEVPPTIPEEFKDNVKRNVTVKNDDAQGANIDAYIRALINVSWQTEDGKIAPLVPDCEGDDANYSMTLNLSDKGWIKGADGYYYWTSPVAPGDSTGVLITEAYPIARDNKLVVEIVAQTIQAEPTSVVLDVWKTGVSGVNGTTLTIKKN